MEDALKYKTLGNTGLLVSEMCLGTMTFGSSKGMWQPISGLDQGAAESIVKTSVDAGINFFDTADVYSEGASENTLGTALKNLAIAREDVVLASKVFGRTGRGQNDLGASRGHILNAVEGSLRRLQTDYLDLYQIHGWDPITPTDEIVRTLDDLVVSGKVRYIGCSNWQAWQIMKALGTADLTNRERFVSLQAYYSIAGRDLEREIAPMLQDQKVGLLVWSPLAGGLLSGKYSREIPTPANSRRSSFDFPIVSKESAWKILDIIRPIADESNTSVASIALALAIVETLRYVGDHRREDRRSTEGQPLRGFAKALPRTSEAAG